MAAASEVGGACAGGRDPDCCARAGTAKTIEKASTPRARDRPWYRRYAESRRRRVGNLPPSKVFSVLNINFNFALNVNVFARSIYGTTPGERNDNTLMS